MNNQKSKTSPKVAVIIPAFNEAEAIVKVLRDIPPDAVNRIVVVDNNSTDTTAENAREAGATVVRETRQGYGAACYRGLEYLKSEPERPDIIAFLDGDYSDYSEEIESLTQPIIEQGYDLVIGSRTLGNPEKGSMSPYQVFGNRLIVLLIRLLYRHNFTDLGPFRAIKFDKLLELDMRDMTYGWTVEMQLKAVKQGLKITEIPVSYRVRTGKSKISGTIKGSLKAGVKILVTIIKYL